MVIRPICGGVLPGVNVAAPSGLDVVPMWCHIDAMELTPFIQDLRDEVALAAEAGGEDVKAAAERLMAPLESAIRLALLNALSTAAAEITSDLAPGSVEVRLRGKEPEFVVTPPAPAESAGRESSPDIEAPAWIPAEGDDTTMTRINLRLPQDLKERVEDAARQAGLSVNAWLVRSAAAALTGPERAPGSSARPSRGGTRYTGWVR
jgi:hypothetical protein